MKIVRSEFFTAMDITAFFRWNSSEILILIYKAPWLKSHNTVKYECCVKLSFKLRGLKTPLSIQYYGNLFAKYFRPINDTEEYDLPDVTPCSPQTASRLGGKYRLLLQGQRVSRARNQQAQVVIWVVTP
jgi:hypothetical protein